MRASVVRLVLKVGVLGMACSAAAFAADAPRAVAAADGSMALPAFTVPYSAYASPESRTRFAQVLVEGRQAPGLSGDIEASRRFYDKINSSRVERMKKIYPVRISTQTIDGVSADVAEPASGISPANVQRVLINLHGGAFLWGAHSGALVEAIPVASLGRIKVISIDYRQGPEHVFPAGSDDVETVYRALLKHYKAENIGIYGCSAGGVLTAEAVARLIKDGVEVPGAIGTFCGSIAPMSGDSSYVGPLLSGDPAPVAPMKLTDLPYFKGASASDPMVFPANSPAILAKFPPTLLITGTRDFSMSSLIQSQRLLSAAGVEADLHIWDGMLHSFFSDPELPESKEAYAVMVRFFERHLGQRAVATPLAIK
jgi:monoterpene epsilon-lactone hydrolase